jgi:threonine dehydrogenase-like Zn-dependent dehydrogenase
LACVLNGYDKLGLWAGADVLVLGAGTVGLLWTQLLSHSPVHRLAQTELVPFRRQKAAQLGADLVLEPGTLSEGLVRLMPEGPDFIIDATGEPAAIQQALPLLGRGGTLLVFGVCPAGSQVTFDPFALYNKEARIVASKMPPMTLDRSARLIESGRIASGPLVTAIQPLSALAGAIEAFHANASSQVKVAIDPWL